jgi:hypothetical protein
MVGLFLTLATLAVIQSASINKTQKDQQRKLD